MENSSLLAAKEQLLKNRDNLRLQIEVAAKNSPHGAEDIQLIAVTKRHGRQEVQWLGEMEHWELGESYVQKGIDKGSDLDFPFRWHFIGHLQSKKVKKALPFYHIIHSVDSVKLLREIERHAVKKEIDVEVLIQVNVSGEESKHGFTPSQLAEILPQTRDLKRTSVVGLMTMAPFVEPEETRPYFRELRKLRDEYRSQYPELKHLSMGMSNDFLVAVEEGATMVRIGTTLFAGMETT